MGAVPANRAKADEAKAAASANAVVRKLHATGHRIATVTVNVALYDDAQSGFALAAGPRGGARRDRMTLFCVRPADEREGGAAGAGAASIAEALAQSFAGGPHFFTSFEAVADWVEEVAAAQAHGRRHAHRVAEAEAAHLRHRQSIDLADVVAVGGHQQGLADEGFEQALAHAVGAPDACGLRQRDVDAGDGVAAGPCGLCIGLVQQVGQCAGVG